MKTISLQHVKAVASHAWRGYAAVTRPDETLKYGSSYTFSRRALSRRTRLAAALVV